MAILDGTGLNILTLLFILLIVIAIDSALLYFIVKKPELKLHKKFKIQKYRYALLATILAVAINLFLSALFDLLKMPLIISLILGTLLGLVTSIAAVRYIYKEGWRESAKVALIWYLVIPIIILGIIVILLVLALLVLESMGIVFSP